MTVKELRLCFITKRQKLSQKISEETKLVPDLKIIKVEKPIKQTSEIKSENF